MEPPNYFDLLRPDLEFLERELNQQMMHSVVLLYNVAGCQQYYL